MKTYHQQTKAFTLLELVFVIVALGILAALAIPRMDRDLRQEAKDNLLSAIRYTQHLALMDDKTDPNVADWQKNLWKISFSVATDIKATFYTISSRRDTDNTVDKDEAAIDPANGKYMFNTNANPTIGSDESPNIFIGKKYGIKTIDFSNCQATANGSNTAKHVAFDQLGRPHKGIGSAANDYGTYMTSDCNITIGFATSGITPLIITIAKETGHVSGD